MPSATITVLGDRGVVAVTGPDAAKLLQGLVTNDVDLLADRPSIAAGLLSPQGKILFDLVVYRMADGLLVETRATAAADLAKRLGLYKLRAQVTIADVSSAWAVVASWDGEVAWPVGSVGGPDPRLAAMGSRYLVPAEAVRDFGSTADPALYDARRVALGVPEGGRDYALGDTFPHEADFDLRAGVSFTKGCYVGQEIVARMQHKTVVRKRVVRIRGTAPLTAGADVMAGEFAIGTVGTVDGDIALAFLKLDRAEELAAKGHGLRVGSAEVEIDPRDTAELAAIATAKAARS
jgi:folate-binding protein YgfZ